MSAAQLPTVWPRELWDAAAAAAEHRIAKLCPLCPTTPGVDGLEVIVAGLGSFMLPHRWNADGLTISVPIDGEESTVTWNPCGHALRVDGRLDR
jgi:hypothetical protein